MVGITTASFSSTDFVTYRCQCSIVRTRHGAFDRQGSMMTRARDDQCCLTWRTRSRMTLSANGQLVKGYPVGRLTKDRDVNNLVSFSDNCLRKNAGLSIRSGASLVVHRSIYLVSLHQLLRTGQNPPIATYTLRSPLLTAWASPTDCLFVPASTSRSFPLFRQTPCSPVLYTGQMERGITR